MGQAGPPRPGPYLLVGIIPGFGDHGGGETPVPFPNTEVKPSSADGTVGATRRESRSLPSIFDCTCARRSPALFLGWRDLSYWTAGSGSASDSGRSFGSSR